MTARFAAIAFLTPGIRGTTAPTVAQEWTVIEMSRKPYFQPRKWKLGNSFGWVNVPYCPHCNRQLGTLAQEQKINECPMCKKPLDW